MLVERGGGQGRIRPTARQVADVEETSGDTRRRPEVVGGSWLGEATVRQGTVARSRACFWLPLALPGVQGVANGVQRVEGVVKKWPVALDALGSHWNEEGGEEEGENCFPEE